MEEDSAAYPPLLCAAYAALLPIDTPLLLILVVLGEWSNICYVLRACSLQSTTFSITVAYHFDMIGVLRSRRLGMSFQRPERLPQRQCRSTRLFYSTLTVELLLSMIRIT